MVKAEKQYKEAREAVEKFLDEFGISITNQAILNKLIALYLDGMQAGLKLAKEILDS